MKSATHLLVAKAYPFDSDILSLNRRKLGAIPLLSSCHTAFKSEGNNFSKAKTKTFVEKSHSLLPAREKEVELEGAFFICGIDLENISPSTALLWVDSLRGSLPRIYSTYFAT